MRSVGILTREYEDKDIRVNQLLSGKVILIIFGMGQKFLVFEKLCAKSKNKAIQANESELTFMLEWLSKAAAFEWIYMVFCDLKNNVDSFPNYRQTGMEWKQLHSYGGAAPPQKMGWIPKKSQNTKSQKKPCGFIFPVGDRKI